MLFMSNIFFLNFFWIITKIGNQVPTFVYIKIILKIQWLYDFNNYILKVENKASQRTFFMVCFVDRFLKIIVWILRII